MSSGFQKAAHFCDKALGLARLTLAFDSGRCNSVQKIKDYVEDGNPAPEQHSGWTSAVDVHCARLGSHHCCLAPRMPIDHFSRTRSLARSSGVSVIGVVRHN